MHDAFLIRVVTPLFRSFPTHLILLFITKGWQQRKRERKKKRCQLGGNHHGLSLLLLGPCVRHTRLITKRQVSSIFIYMYISGMIRPWLHAWWWTRLRCSLFIFAVGPTAIHFLIMRLIRRTGRRRMIPIATSIDVILISRGTTDNKKRINLCAGLPLPLSSTSNQLILPFLINHACFSN